MRDELDKALCERYPKIFSERDLPMSETCMCWGFTCGDGWYAIINELCAAIQWHIDAREKSHLDDLKYNAAIDAEKAGDRTLLEQYFSRSYNTEENIAEAVERGAIPVRKLVPQVVAAQVKEKFGHLNFYYNGGDEYVRGLVTMAESISAVSCETCGAPGKLRRGGWLRTLCDQHAVEKR